ncbi:MAG: hypothetical protein M3O71_14700 [Bacteroidota bacterium]|nr:hypothetical protein [Bacteroidota bacterium]
MIILTKIKIADNQHVSWRSARSMWKNGTLWAACNSVVYLVDDPIFRSFWENG